MSSTSVQLWKILFKPGRMFPICSGPRSLKSPPDLLKNPATPLIISEQTAWALRQNDLHRTPWFGEGRLTILSGEALKNSSQVADKCRRLSGDHKALGVILLSGSENPREAQYLADLIILGAVQFEPSKEFAIDVLVFDGAEAMQVFFQPSSDEVKSYRVDKDIDPDVASVEAYLEEKRIVSLPPREISNHKSLFPVSLHAQEDRTIVEVDYRRIPRGYVRLVSDKMLDDAMRLVPEYIRAPRADLLSGFFYTRLRGRASELGATIAADGMKYEAKSTFIVSRHVVVLGKGDKIPKGQSCIVGEIGLWDSPEADVAHSNSLRQHICADHFPKRYLKFLRDFGMSLNMPEGIYQEILEKSPDLERFDFSPDELDKALVFNILHQCARILWFALPEELKSRWKIEFPVKNNHRTAIYFRSLIQKYIDNDVSGEKFSTSTMADVLALYWMGEKNTPHYLAALNKGLVTKHLGFLRAVMKWCQEKHDRCGSVFLVEKPRGIV